MVNKQKMWFLTLFSLILILSVYYITMPSELLTKAGKMDNSKVKTTKKINKEASTNVMESDSLTALQVESDEERATLAASYNEILTNKNATVEEKNNAYEGLKEINEIKAKEESLVKKIKNDLKLKSFIKIDGNNISVTIKKLDHDYSLANSVMRLIQKEFENKMYISVKFQK